MIDGAIGALASQLNQFYRRTLALSEDIVEVSNLVDGDGAVAPTAENKIVLLLVNIERDTTPQRGGASGYSGLDRIAGSGHPVYLNLYVLVAANFGGKNYVEALKHLSHAIAFFQKQPVFDRHSAPDMDRRVDRLVLDIENLSIQDLSNLWGALGGKYLPSVLYKVRMVAISGDDVVAQVPRIVDPRPVLGGGE